MIERDYINFYGWRNELNAYSQDPGYLIKEFGTNSQHFWLSEKAFNQAYQAANKTKETA